MASADNWCRKIVVKNLPLTCSNELLCNYLESMMEQEVEDDGILYFHDIRHTALVSFVDPLTDAVILEAVTRSRKEPLEGKKLLLLPIKQAPTAILVSNLKPQISRDTLFYYFESPSSGILDGEVNDCTLFPELDMAIVIFTTSTGAESVLAKSEHYPTRDCCVYVEICYEEFHMPLLQEVRDGSRGGKIEHDAHSQLSQDVETLADHDTYYQQEERQQRHYQSTDSSVDPHELYAGNQRVTKSKNEPYNRNANRNYQNNFRSPHRTHNEMGRGDQNRENTVWEQRRRGFSKEFNPKPWLRGQRRGKNPSSFTPSYESTIASSSGQRYISSAAYSGPRQRYDQQGENTFYDDTTTQQSSTFHYPQFEEDYSETSEQFSELEQDYTKPREPHGVRNVHSAGAAEQAYLIEQYESGENSTDKIASVVYTSRHPNMPLPSDPSSSVVAKDLSTLKANQDREAKKLLLELEEMKKTMEKVKDLQSFQETVPAYRLRLLKDFARNWTKCKVIINEQENVVHFYGTENDCLDARCEFLTQIQGLLEDTLQIPSQLTAFMQSPPFDDYLKKLAQTYSSCSVDVQGDSVVCAGHSKELVQACLGQIKTDIHQESCVVKTSLLDSSQFTFFKFQLQVDHHVCLSMDKSTGKVTVGGIGADVDTAVKKLIEFDKSAQTCQKTFYIEGALAERVCQKWFTTQLESVKQFIMQNQGKITVKSPAAVGYTLMYECPEKVVDKVEEMLADIKKDIFISKIDLQLEFTKYSEQALVIHGLNAMGMDVFCTRLENILKDQNISCALDIKLPAKFVLPVSRFCTKKEAKQLQIQSERKNYRHSKSSRYAPHKSRLSSLQPFQPVTITFGSTTIIVKPGDITKEKVDVLVSIVGEDLGLKGTAIGGAILRKWHQAEKVLQSAKQPDEKQLVITSVPEKEQSKSDPIPTSKSGETLPPPDHKKQRKPTNKTFKHFFNRSENQPQSDEVKQDAKQLDDAKTSDHGLNACFVFHAILSKWPSDKVNDNVQGIMQRCLLEAEKLNQHSIAFPPLGMGKRFQLPEDKVVDAMASSTVQFLQTNHTYLKRVVFVISDEELAKLFIVVLNTLTTVVPNTGTASTQETLQEAAVEADDDSEDEDDAGNSDNELCLVVNEDTISSSSGKFEASFYAENKDSSDTVKLHLTEELREIFLYNEIMDMTTIKGLDQQALQEIESLAAKESTILSMMTDKDGQQQLLVQGQKVCVLNVKTFIHTKLLEKANLDKEMTEKKRRDLGGAHTWPAYWKLSKRRKNKEVWDYMAEKSSEHKLYPADVEEKTAVEKLIQDTWDVQFVGIGKDSKELQHKNIQVVGVERLESPELWERYCEKRSKFIRRLKGHHADVTKTSLAPVENLPNSTGPVRTTKNLPNDSPLRREMHFEVNEHYLFHGFKIDMKDALTRDGLDFRLANKAMLGRGIYAAESATKADQYADEKTKRTDGHKSMILLRAVLGEPYVSNVPRPNDFNRPPCKQCSHDKCTCKNSVHYDSIIDDFSGRNFREFVIYDQSLCYPEYFITYVRV